MSEVIDMSIAVALIITYYTLHTHIERPQLQNYCVNLNKK
jgi:hypothetical protein